jgi:murein DD-endopeptidase MepM/ murein hydrolase activator NlpD
MIKYTLGKSKIYPDTKSNREKALFTKPLILRLAEINDIHVGSKISRFFRHVFEHKNVKKILGVNLAVMVLASNFVTTKATDSAQPESPIVIEETIPLVTERARQYPVVEFHISQGYGFFHPAIDLAAPYGDEVKPIMAGKIEAVSRSRYAYGNAIIVNHGNNLTSLYAHLSKILVTEGQEVTTNTVIGLVGSTGRSTGNHVHLEVRDNGRAINPTSILPFPKI